MGISVGPPADCPALWKQNTLTIFFSISSCEFVAKLNTALFFFTCVRFSFFCLLVCSLVTHSVSRLNHFFGIAISRLCPPLMLSILPMPVADAGGNFSSSHNDLGRAGPRSCIFSGPFCWTRAKSCIRKMNVQQNGQHFAHTLFYFYTGSPFRTKFMRMNAHISLYFLGTCTHLWQWLRTETTESSDEIPIFSIFGDMGHVSKLHALEHTSFQSCMRMKAHNFLNFFDTLVRIFSNDYKLNQTIWHLFSNFGYISHGSKLNAHEHTFFVRIHTHAYLVMIITRINWIQWRNTHLFHFRWYEPCFKVLCAWMHA